MFLKELKDSLKQLGSIMAFLAVMPLIYLLDSSFYKTGTTILEYIAGGFALLWMIAIGYLAYNMFRPEEKDNAVEYILFEFGFLTLILIPLYRNWDLKPVRARELSFANRTIVPLILLAYPVVYLFSS